MKKNKLTALFMLLFLCLISYSIISQTVLSVILSKPLLILVSVLSGILLAVITNTILMKFARLVKSANFTQLLLSLITIMFGGIFGGMLALPVSSLPGWFGQYGPIIVVIFTLILCGLIFSYRKEAFSEFANRISNGKLQFSEVASRHQETALLDTSVIIDGRIADIAHCGFVPGTLIVPNFILSELQFIADSEDTQRRQRGRRGLETLSNMQKDPAVSIQITEFEVPNIREADAKLLHVALELECPILTNDYNLNKVAELQGVRILNVNDLTNAVKSILLPGEKLIVNVIQEGKEINQGVGYMEDGTMVVVENGRPYLGQQIDAVVTKILQTAAGRMIFARHEKEFGVRR